MSHIRLSLSAGVDTGDLQRREMLTMTAFAMRVLAALLLEGHDLFAPAMLDDLGMDYRTRNERRARFRRIPAQKQHFFQLKRGSGIAVELLNGQDIVHRHPVLLPAAADYRKHRLNSLNSARAHWAAQPAVRREAGQYTYGRRRVKRREAVD